MPLPESLIWWVSPSEQAWPMPTSVTVGPHQQSGPSVCTRTISSITSPLIGQTSVRVAQRPRREPPAAAQPFGVRLARNTNPNTADNTVTAVAITAADRCRPNAALAVALAAPAPVPHGNDPPGAPIPP